MPIFEINDGENIYEVNAPDQATAIAAFKSMVGDVPPAPGPIEYAAMGATGVNKGIGNMLSLPAMVGNGLWNLGPSISNSLFGTNFKADAEIFPDPGATYKRLMAPAAYEPAEGDMTGRVISRIGEEVGATLFPGGAWAKSAKELAALAALGVSSGTGAAAANEIAPGNPWAEMGGQLLGGFAPLGVAAATRAVTLAPDRRLARALASDQVPAGLVQTRLNALGPDAMVGDLGPNLQGLTAALATKPGDAQKRIVDALTQRKEAANSRIIADVDASLGPAPVPSVIEAEIQANMDALGPQYQDLFRTEATRVDTTPIAQQLEAQIVSLRGDAQAALRKVRGMLDITGAPGNLDPNPYTLFQVRQAIDGMFATEANPKAIAALTQVRKDIDAILADAVPGIKVVDAKFAELARQREALTLGQQMLDSGRTATRPQELDLMMTEGAIPHVGMGPSGVPFRLSQGGHAEIERIIGTNTNDVVAMKRIIKGDGNWNRDRLVSLFGQEKADDLLAILEREVAYAKTQELALEGSRTDLLRSAKKEIEPDARTPGVMQNALNLQIGSALAKGSDRALGWIARGRRKQNNSAIAEALMGGGEGVSEAVLRASESFIPAAQRPIFAALLAGQAANQNQWAPLRRLPVPGGGGY